MALQGGYIFVSLELINQELIGLWTNATPTCRNEFGSNQNAIFRQSDASEQMPTASEQPDP